MLSVLEIIVPLILVILVVLPLVKVFAGKTTLQSARKRLYTHISLFFGLILFVFVWQLSGTSLFAAETAETVSGEFAGSIAQGLGFLGAALTTGVGSIGAGIAVAAAAPAAIGAFSENEKNFGKSLIFVALGEGVAIYGLLISILIINKL
ncbi:MAG: ATP synthase subunit C [Acholeplasma sp.]|uniref:ATP synthase F(0) sector subunit c n=1 Tax=Hujiaoplasma nucleasis TaxID=2725268 RepID=A0A7L6N7P5_9MOLU|nr:ATP synthase subunit C [Hujiaoplasma nucleasis]MDY0278878.1 ATP synthase subunit C [Acholeplasma sp.]QLY40559.1 ATPase [Hujiaoplasma nucleasis]